METLYILFPRYRIENSDQTFSFLFNISVLNSPYHFIKVALEITFNFFESPGSLSHFGKYQFKLFDLAPHVFVSTHLISSLSYSLDSLHFDFIATQSLVIIKFIKPFPTDHVVVRSTYSRVLCNCLGNE